MKRVLIIGAGFAGMYAATSAARLRDLQGVSPDDTEVALIAPGRGSTKPTRIR
jgi:NADH dehydrogenase